MEETKGKWGKITVKPNNTNAGLAEANKELLQALKSTNQLNLHLYKEGTIGNEVYKEIQAAIKKHSHA